MGASSSKETSASAAVEKVSTRAEKVLKSVNGDIKSAAQDVTKGINKAADKTSKAVKKTGKEVEKTIDDLLAEPKKEKNHDTAIAVGVPLVALVVAVGYVLYKHKPWKKNGDSDATIA